MVQVVLVEADSKHIIEVPEALDVIEDKEGVRWKRDGIEGSSRIGREGPGGLLPSYDPHRPRYVRE